jgi:hypothetical protein
MEYEEIKVDPKIKLWMCETEAENDRRALRDG